jgi:hypothetical protein
MRMQLNERENHVSEMLLASFAVGAPIEPLPTAGTVPERAMNLGIARWVSRLGRRIIAVSRSQNRRHRCRQFHLTFHAPKIACNF